MIKTKEVKVVRTSLERNAPPKRQCGVVTAADMDPFIRQGMTRYEARRAALKLKLRRHQ